MSGWFVGTYVQNSVEEFCQAASWLWNDYRNCQRSFISDYHCWKKLMFHVFFLILWWQIQSISFLSVSAPAEVMLRWSHIMLVNGNSSSCNHSETSKQYWIENDQGSKQKTKSFLGVCEIDDILSLGFYWWTCEQMYCSSGIIIWQ